MKMPYEIFIALRYLRAKRRQTLISAITFISIIGVAIGVMALILVLGVMTGFTDDLREKILGSHSHIVITGYGSGISEYREIMESLESVGDITASTPVLLSQVMISGGSGVTGVLLHGIDTASAAKVFNLEDTIVKGDIKKLDTAFHEGTGSTGIIIGVEMAGMLGVDVGSVVRIISPSGLLSPAGMMPRWKRFIVEGIFESGMYEYDTGFAYISLFDAQRFLRMPDEVTLVAVKTADIHRTDSVVNRIKEEFGDFYSVRDWKEMHKNLYYALKLEKTAMFVILVLIIIVAAFSIVATLIMMVHDKNREIAVLKSMGARSGSIMKIFMFQGLVIGVVGTVIGLVAGYFLAFLQNNFQIVSLSKDVYYIASLTVKTSFADTFWVVFCAILISFMATLYPSRQAAALDPAEALRYE